jgi:hypothetical protein
VVIVRKSKSLARAALEFLNTHSKESRAATAVEKLEKSTAPHFVEPGLQHLQAAIHWIKTAQDATVGGGVSWGFRARRPVRTAEKVGWESQYPETTGYIIPTMIRYAEMQGDSDALDRARRMTQWELSIQLSDGGIQGGIYGSQPVASSTFVTGQVLFGFNAAYAKFRDESIRRAAIRAADWLCGCLDDTGRFVRGFSHFCEPGPKAYEARTGLALAECGDLLDQLSYRQAASKMADYALSMQRRNGWFAENDLDRHEEPLTHTIGYVLEGLHGIGTRQGRHDCLQAVDRTLDALVVLIRQDGFLAGRLRSDWSAAVDWACLTGSSQIAGVFIRRHLETGKDEYLDAGRKLLGFVCFTQDLRPGITGIDGGIRGSYPFGGRYGRWCVLNWATKFFADSIMDLLCAKDLVRRETVLAASSQNGS